MITINIDESKLKEMLSETLKENIEDILKNRHLEYWVRGEVHKLLAKEVMEKTVKPMLTQKEIKKLLKEAFNTYVYNTFKESAEE